LKTEWIYGNHRNLGWGGAEIELDQYSTLDFDPEFECKRDVKLYWKNRKHILSLPKYNILKYIKTLLFGILKYNKLTDY
jgi:hypothetical protein